MHETIQSIIDQEVQRVGLQNDPASHNIAIPLSVQDELKEDKNAGLGLKGDGLDQFAFFDQEVVDRVETVREIVRNIAERLRF